MKRPPALVVVTIVAMVLGTAQVVAAAGYLKIAGFEALQATWLRGDLGAVSSTAIYIAGIGLIVVGLSGIVFGVSALFMQRWAWALGVATYIIGVFGGVLWLFATQAGVAAGGTGILSAMIAWYLSTYDVREAFGQQIAAPGGHRPHAV
jgi:hypothetical protein